ncbi:MAG: DMT family transporter [Bacillota bacterium]
MNTRRFRSLAADLILLAIAAFWGLGFVLTKYILAYVPPLLFLGVRFSLSALIMLVARPKYVFHLRSRPLPVLTTGAFLCLAYILQTVGMNYTSASRAAFITGLYMVFVPVISTVVSKRSPSALAWAGALLATVGLGVMTGLARDGQYQFLEGEALVLGCALFFGLQILAVDKYSPRYDLGSFTFGQISVVGIGCLIPALLFERLPAAVPAGVALAVVFLALPNTIGATYAQAWAQRLTVPWRAAILLAMEPVFTLIFAGLALGESFSPGEALGAVLMLAGGLLAELEHMPQNRRQREI